MPFMSLKNRRWSGLAASLGFAMLLASATPSAAAALAIWANRLFPERSIDFGSVPRGAVLTHAFTLANQTDGPVQIVGVRASCGCTSGRITSQMIPPGGQGVVEAVMDTTQFTGRKATKLYVKVQDRRGRRAEVTLDVAATIQSHVVVRPGVVDFGAIASGTPQQKDVRIAHAGSRNWQIQRVVTNHPSVQAELVPTRRDAEQVGYRLQVQVKPDAPAGWFRDQIRLVTNDPRTPVVPVQVSGYVQPGVTVSPSPLPLRPTPDRSRQVGRAIVRGDQPFLITGFQSDQPGITLECPTSSQKRPAHVVMVRFDPNQATKRDAVQKASTSTTEYVVRIQTDLPGQPVAEVPVRVRAKR